MARVIDVKEIPIKQLRVDAANVRRKGVADLRDLEDSIEEHGILENLIVRPKGGDKYGVVVGSRRFEAAKALGLRTLPCVIKDLSDEEAIIESLVENIQRGELDPEDETRAIGKLYEIYKSQSKVAKVLGKSERYVGDHLTAGGLIETITRARFSTPIEIPRDVKKTAEIARVAERVYKSPKEKALLLQTLGDRPREDVRRVLTIIKDSAERGSVLAPKKAVEKALRTVNVTVTVQFDSRVSKAIIRAAEDRRITWEDVVRNGAELWLRKENYL